MEMEAESFTLCHSDVDGVLRSQFGVILNENLELVVSFC